MRTSLPGAGKAREGSATGRMTIKLVGLAIVASYLVTLLGYQAVKRSRVATLSHGSRIAMTAAGPIEYGLDGTGPTVVILPGTFGGFDQAMQAGGPLVAAGFRVLGVSRPGYLNTPIAAGRTPAEQANAVAMLIDSLDLGPVAVVAISGGGPAALELASRHPGSVARLVLFAALSGPKAQAAAQPTRLTRITDRLFGEGFLTWWQTKRYQASGTAVLASPIFGEDSRRRLGDDPTKLAKFFQLAWFRFPPALREAGYRNDREQFGSFVFEAFDAIKAPTLIIHGTADRNAPIEHGDRAAREIAGAEYWRIEGGDHYSSIAREDEVWGRVAAFLRQPTLLPAR